MNNSPPILVARALKYYFQGRIHFDRNVVGNTLKEDDEYEIFRKIVLDSSDGQQNGPGATLRVTFSFASMSIAVNKKLSLIPIPFIIAQEGFRSKTWMIGKNTEKFQGLYEWASVEAAENYWKSFPMKMMKQRSVSSSLQLEIHANI